MQATVEHAEERVAPLELFFDLVFVLAVTQVTALMADEFTPLGVLRGLLVLAAIWWAWAGYAWLTNEVDTRRADVRLSLFASMAAMLIASLAVPQAFSGSAMTFALGYLVVRVLHIVVFAHSSADLAVAAAVRALAPTALLAPALLVGAAFLASPRREIVWVSALAVDYVGAGIRGIGGWRLSPGHFAERHGLIVIIALGESIVAIGIALHGAELAAEELAGAVLGVALAAALWWVYFDLSAARAESALRAAPRGESQNVLARDVYSYLHLPLVAGVVLLALGIKKSLEEVGEPLDVVAASALCLGVAAFLGGVVLFTSRATRSWELRRLATCAVLITFVPLALRVPAIVALATVSAVCMLLIGVEARARRREPLHGGAG